MAKYAYPGPLDYVCRSCKTEFYRKDLIQSWGSLGIGSCPQCKTKNYVFSIKRDGELDDNQ